MSARERSGLERVLSIVTELRPGEGITALLLALNVFVLLTAYYVIKPVREALILAMESGAQYKSYMSAGIALGLLVVVPMYSRYASRVRRNRLVVGVTLFFVSHLAIFYVASQFTWTQSFLGLLFYLWVGIFNMMVVAQFWAFANDVYAEAEGKRIFPLIGLGASIGAAIGSFVSGQLIRVLGTYPMLLVAGLLLSGCALLTHVVHVRESGRPNSAYGVEEEKTDAKPSAPKGAFAMVLSSRYLILLALFSFIFTFVNTNGEFMLSLLISNTADGLVEAGKIAADAKGQYIGAQYSDFFFYVNILGVLMQMLVVSRLVKYFGLGPSFFILPVIAFLDATAVAILPILTILYVGKILENATDYSLNNTLRNMLWLPTTREMKYRAKQAVDTFCVRMGDVSSAVLVFLGSNLLAFDVRSYALSNVALVGVWLALAWFIVREYHRMTGEKQANSPLMEH
ncbi:MAG: NTP/NDP exchange transporter [Myxococcota bacterium]